MTITTKVGAHVHVFIETQITLLFQYHSKEGVSSSRRPYSNLECIYEVIVSMLKGKAPSELLPLISSLATVLKCKPELASQR